MRDDFIAGSKSKFASDLYKDAGLLGKIDKSLKNFGKTFGAAKKPIGTRTPRIQGAAAVGLPKPGSLGKPLQEGRDYMEAH